MTSQECKALVFCCSDFRLVEPIKNWLDEKHLASNYDLVSVSGGVSKLDSIKENFLVKQIEAAIAEHNISEVFLIAHNDCSAHGGRGSFDSSEAENDFYLLNLQKTKEKINSLFPEIQVKNVLVKINPLGQINFEENV